MYIVDSIPAGDGFLVVRSESVYGCGRSGMPNALHSRIHVSHGAMLMNLAAHSAHILASALEIVARRIRDFVVPPRG